MAEMNTLIIGIETKGAKEAATELDHLAKSGEKAEKKTKGIGKGAGQTVAPFKAMRGATQQASFQLQDIAVQAQSGTDAFIIIGQQGPQLASIFGPGGAVFGAVIAFGALLGGLLVSQMGSTGDAFKRLEEDMEGLEDKFDDLTEAQKEYVRLKAAKTTEDNIAAFRELQRELNTLKSLTLSFNQIFFGSSSEEKKERIIQIKAEMDTLTSANTELAEKTDAVTQAHIDAAKAEKDYVEKLSDEFLQLTLTGDALLQYNAIKAGATAESLEAAVALQKEINALKAKQQADKDAAAQKIKDDAAALTAAVKAKADADKLEDDLESFFAKEHVKRDAKKLAAQENLALIEQSLMSERELVSAYAAEDIARITADRDANLISAEQFNIAKGQIEQDAANQRVAITTEEEQKKADLRNAVNQQLLGQAAGIAGQLTSMAAAAYGEESAAYKAFFLLQQGIAIAQTIVSTQVAAMGMMAALPGPPGIAMAGKVQAMGAVSVGLIAGQTVAGLARANGGQVRGGESYLVGERGPELLTMGTSGRIATNENLKSAMNSEGSMQQAQNVSVNFTIQANDTAGFDDLLNSRRGQIINMVNRAVNNRGRASIT